MCNHLIDSNLKQTELDCLNVSDDEARVIIIAYMKKHDRAYPSDISLDERLDYGQVMRITRRLLDEGLIE